MSITLVTNYSWIMYIIIFANSFKMSEPEWETHTDEVKALWASWIAITVSYLRFTSAMPPVAQRSIFPHRVSL